METKNVWETYSKQQLKELEIFSNDYINFLSVAKTERECIDEIIIRAEKEGYIELEKIIKEGKKLQVGDKIYSICMGKTIALFQIGKEPLENGMNILGAHIDSPRLDVKSNPLYEEGGFAYLDTHYYGGIKKYQWVTIPLAIHGVVIKKDGTTIILNIGENEDDPVFFVSDLLVHLSKDQMDKKASDVIEGEMLDVIVGNRPIFINNKEKNIDEDNVKKDDKDTVKKYILNILKDTYDMAEDDFLSAELEIVPAGRAREAGFDRSMILAYGQDDRVCSYASLIAFFEAKDLERTTCCILTDKEEIGSVGATGMQSNFFENTVAEILNLSGEYNELTLKRCLKNSHMLSSDVTTGFDPTFASSFDKKNVAYFGKGLVFNKFTGSRGKSGSNDANPEYIAKLRNIFQKDNILFQMSELGKVDAGGGGTIAYILALYGMNVIDCGVALLNMHAPWEASSKIDVYEMKRGYISFLRNMK